MKLIIMGPQGSGKGTQAQILKEKLNIPHISTGNIFREAAQQGTEAGIKAKTYWESGGLVPDEVTNQIIRERLEKEDCQKGFILDGYPRTIEQAQFLNTITQIDYALLIDISDEEAIKRISGRRTCKKCGKVYHITYNPPKDGKCDCGGEIIQREDDVEEKIKKRLQIYHEQTKPVIEYYEKKGIIKKIDGGKEIENITKEIEKIIL